jgi:hypothetical protein
MKTMEGQEIEVRSLACSTLGYRGVLEFRDATRKNNKQLIHSLKFAQTKQHG